MSSDAPYRELLARLLAWGDAHVSFDAAIADYSAYLNARGVY